MARQVGTLCCLQDSPTGRTEAKSHDHPVLKEEPRLFAVLLYVVLVGEDDYTSGVTGLHQPRDDLVKLSSCWFTWDLHRLSNAHAACQRAREAETKRERGNVSLKCPLVQVALGQADMLNRPMICAPGPSAVLTKEC